MKIVVVGSQGCLPSGFIGLVDLLSLAKRAIAAGDPAAALYEVCSASIDGRPVRDGTGRLLEVDLALRDVGACDAIVIPGFVPDDDRRPPLLGAFAETAAWIRRHHAQGTLVCGSCSGVFMLGEAGLLDGRRCTTTWWLHDELKRRYPKALAAWGTALMEDRGVISAGGPLSWIDLSLYVVRTLCGGDAARIAADFAVVDTAPSSQAIYIPAGHLAASNPLLADAENIVRRAAESQMTARDLARHLALSERTLHRRLDEATGESPKQFIDRVRFELAKDLIETTAKSVKQIAASTGYVDEGSFRRTFKRLYGMSPASYRIWARSRRDGQPASAATADAVR